VKKRRFSVEQITAAQQIFAFRPIRYGRVPIDTRRRDAADMLRREPIDGFVSEATRPSPETCPSRKHSGTKAFRFTELPKRRPLGSCRFGRHQST